MEREALTWGERGQLWLRLGIRLGLTALCLWLLLRFWAGLLSLTAPFAGALLAAVGLNGPVRWLQRRLGWSRRLLTLLLLLLLLALLGAGAALLLCGAWNELGALLQNWDGLLSGVQSALERLEEQLLSLRSQTPPGVAEAVEETTDHLLDWLGQAVPTALRSLFSAAGQWAMALPSFVVAVTVFVMAAYFLTADFPYLRSRLAQRMDAALLLRLGQLRDTVLGAFGGYLRAQLLLSAGVFALLLGAFLLLRQPYALLLALLLAVLDFIPIVGAGTVMVPWALVAFVNRDYPAAIRMALLWGAITLLRRGMEPKFVGDQTGLSPIQSLMSIYGGMRLGGVAGMILGPVLLLVLLNLEGMGLFSGLQADVRTGVEDVLAILSQRPRGKFKK